VLEELSKALATDQQMVRQSLLPAIGLPPDIFLSVQIDSGLLKITPTAIKEAVSSPLEAAGFKVIFEVPDDREYLLVQYRFSQVSNTQGGFAAYTASISCFGLAWQSGAVRPMLLVSNHTGGYAGKNSDYSKSVLEDAVMFGEMLADSLGKIDRDALAVNYDIFDPDEKLADAASKLRELSASNEKPVASTGTGFIASTRGLIVTNHHVIKGHDQVEIRVPSSGKTLIAQVIAADKSNDLAFLRVAQSTDLPSDLVIPIIAKKLPEVGQTVFTVGFPVPEIMGMEPKFSQGVLNAHTGGRDNTRLLQHSIPIQPGNSGGFLVSEAGEVCGVVQSTLNTLVLLGEAGALPQNVNYAIKSERLWDFASDQGLSSELSEGERKPIEAKDALRLSVMITTRVK
jgi:S1-C subfamily serine protease